MYNGTCLDASLRHTYMYLPHSSHAPSKQQPRIWMGHIRYRNMAHACLHVRCIRDFTVFRISPLCWTGRQPAILKLFRNFENSEFQNGLNGGMPPPLVWWWNHYTQDGLVYSKEAAILLQFHRTQKCKHLQWAKKKLIDERMSTSINMLICQKKHQQKNWSIIRSIRSVTESTSSSAADCEPGQAYLM
jgi:hypothetical protein